MLAKASIKDITSSDLPGVVHDDHLSGEHLSLLKMNQLDSFIKMEIVLGTCLGGIVLGVRGDGATTDVLDRDVLH
jgi:hypothetical protein